MSYDLFLRPRAGELPRERFEGYFGRRPGYQINDGGQAWYENKDTSCYFSFAWQEPEPDPDPEGDSVDPHHPVAFNLNYFRPSWFAREAEPELSAFIREFDLVVMDPQMQGMGNGEYSPEGFLRGWDHGNAFGYLSVLSDARTREQRFPRMPAATLERAWNWNRNRDARGVSLQLDRFVPLVMFLDDGTSTRTASVWPDALPSLFTPVDCIIVHRQELAPRSFLRRKPDTLFLDWQEVLPTLLEFGRQLPDGSVLIDSDVSPAGLKAWVKSLAAREARPTLVSADQVLDQELFDQAIEAPVRR